MRIATSDGTAVTLQPRGWAPPTTGEADDELVISGHVTIGDRDWSFTRPCLQIGEAYNLARWLRAAADGSLQPAPAPESPADDWPQLDFLDLSLAFSLAARDQGQVVVRAYFTQDAAPPWLDEPASHTGQQVVELRVRPDDLTAAAAEWTKELDALVALR